MHLTDNIQDINVYTLHICMQQKLLEKEAIYLKRHEEDLERRKISQSMFQLICNLKNQKRSKFQKMNNKKQKSNRNT